VTPEVSRGRELSEFVPNHVLAYIYRHVPAAIMNRYGVPNHLREDSGIPGPRTYDLPLARGVEQLYLPQQPAMGYKTRRRKLGKDLIVKARKKK